MEEARFAADLAEERAAIDADYERRLQADPLGVLLELGITRDVAEQARTVLTEREATRARFARERRDAVAAIRRAKELLMRGTGESPESA
jgi:hypothetical protein